MKVLMTAKVQMFLVISSILAVWMLLAAPHVQAHDSTVSLPTPTCSNLPSESGFLTALPITTSTDLGRVISSRGQPKRPGRWLRES
jgi:hypothetical protein